VADCGLVPQNCGWRFASIYPDQAALGWWGRDLGDACEESCGTDKWLPGDQRLRSHRRDDVQRLLSGPYSSSIEKDGAIGRPVSNSTVYVLDF